MKVLVLHQYASSGIQIKKEMRTWEEAFPEIQFVYLDGPFKIKDGKFKWSLKTEKNETTGWI